MAVVAEHYAFPKLLLDNGPASIVSTADPEFLRGWIYVVKRQCSITSVVAADLTRPAEHFYGSHLYAIPSTFGNAAIAQCPRLRRAAPEFELSVTLTTYRFLVAPLTSWSLERKAVKAYRSIRYDPNLAVYSDAVWKRLVALSTSRHLVRLDAARRNARAEDALLLSYAT